MDNYGEYNGDTEHDMWVDYTYHVNTSELYDYFDDSHSSVYEPNSPKPRQSNTQSSYGPRKRLKSYLKRISSLQSKIEADKKLIHDIDWRTQRLEPAPKLSNQYSVQKQQAEYRIEKCSKKLAKLQKKIPSIEAAIINEDNKAITILAVVLTCGIIFLFLMLLTTIIEV